MYDIISIYTLMQVYSRKLEGTCTVSPKVQPWLVLVKKKKNLILFVEILKIIMDKYIVD